MNILITNDDGINSPGIKALLKSVPKEMKVMVVAPVNEKSASSHSISLGQKLRIEEFRRDGVQQFAVHGTPADCVKFAVCGIQGFSPDLILSGINQGANTGVSVFYSGTISGAREGFINRVPSVAISLCSKGSHDFQAGMEFSRRLIQGYAEKIFPVDVMLNINVPALPPAEIRGIKITKQAASHFVEEFVPEKQEEGKRVYMLAGEIEIYDSDGTSDEEAVLAGFISITPLKLDLTDYNAIPFFEAWKQRGGGS